MPTRQSSRPVRSSPIARAIGALVAGGACVLATAVGHAASVTSAPPELRVDRRADIDAMGADIRSSVRAALAQAGDDAGHADRVRQTLAQLDLEGIMGDGPALAFIASDFGGARDIVKNAPYQAEAITESVQVLADGNRIVRKSAVTLARDAFGRTRQERKGERGSSVYIFDPIDGRSYALDTDRRTAFRIPRAPLPPLPPEPQAAGGGAPIPPPTPPAVSRGKEVDVAPSRVIVRKQADGTPGADDVHVEVIRVGRADLRQGPGAFAPFGLPVVPRGKGETRKIGSRDFDGIRAEGTQTTHTIPAGEIGNEKPILVTTERWFSPELHVVVYARSTDPRAGDTTYRLANVKRGEPPPELFRLPDDYRVSGEPKPR